MSRLTDYLQECRVPDREALERLCVQVRQLVPDCQDGWSYGIPALMYKGWPLIGFAATKNHLSLYPHSGKIIEVLQVELTEYDCTSGSIHFTPEQGVANKLLEKIIRLRLSEISEKQPR